MGNEFISEWLGGYGDFELTSHNGPCSRLPSCSSRPAAMPQSLNLVRTTTDMTNVILTYSPDVHPQSMSGFWLKGGVGRHLVSTVFHSLIELLVRKDL